MPELPMGALVAALAFLPFLTCLVLGAWIFVLGAPSERAAYASMNGALVISAALLGVATATLVSSGAPMLEAPLGPWFEAGEYRFDIGFLLDELSLAMAWTVVIIALLVSRFGVHYMHREPGFARFYAMLGLCASGLLVLALAASYDLLFIGWEMVGLSSVMLVAFFFERPAPTRAALRVLVTYRVADAGILFGVVVLHQAAGSTEYAAVFDHRAWPGGVAHIGPAAATVVSLLFLLSAMGKSALFPLGGWLPRAMEGPTPSSALFYGALSIHGGAFLLLRTAPLLEASPIARVVVLVVGVLTAVHGAVVGRVQTDAKSQMAYATMAQLGVIVVEIALGFYMLGLVHLVGHAFLRGYQLLRAPSALADVQRIRAALAGRALPSDNALERALPISVARALYRFALDRFFVDAILERFVVNPVISLGELMASTERGVVRAMHGSAEPSVRPGAQSGAQPSAQPSPREDDVVGRPS